MTEFPNLRFGPMPAMRPIGTGREVELLELLWVGWDDYTLTVPEGFVHDGPSIPNRLRGVVYYNHRLLKPSIAHDFVYETLPEDWTRARADALLLEGLVVEGVGWLRRNMVWSAVRAGGWKPWRD